MRTTIDLPADLHSTLTSLAHSSRKSLSRTAVELMRRGLEGSATPASDSQRVRAVSPTTGLPLVRFPRTISEEDVRALVDEA